MPARDPQFPPINRLGDTSTEVLQLGTPSCGSSSAASQVHPTQLLLLLHLHPTSPPSPHCPQDYSPERLAYENRRKAAFYSDDTCRRMYKDHMRAVSE